MKVEKVPVDKAPGHILLHNQMGHEGRRVLKKGHLLSEDDVSTLRELGKDEVYVAMLAQDDVAENEAARRIGDIVRTEHIETSTATTGRVNLLATSSGLFKVNQAGLLALNDRASITLATIANNTPVRPKKIVGTIKIIPYGVPEAELEAAAAVTRQESPLVDIKPFVVGRAALITTGSETAREKVVGSFTPALRERLAGYDTEMIEGPYVPENEADIGEALQWALGSGVGMILVAGETSIMDADDITPRAIKAIGGEIVHHGVPVEPGNLFLLAYRESIPIVGAPGCAKSKSYNVVDMVLPRLAAGERLSRRDLIELGHGGLLK
jgi:molybdenum cofactor cytidylyltransferase